MLAKNRQATATVFGFDFQVNAAIFLMLRNVHSLESLRLEGRNEDIEIELQNGQSILAQAKAVVNGSHDFRNVRKNLKKSLQTLSEGALKVQPKELIVVTNSLNPFNEKKSYSVFIGGGLPTYRQYKDLPPEAQKIVCKYLSEIPSPLNTEILSIQTIPFETDDAFERYKFIQKAVNEFLLELHVQESLGKNLLSYWQHTIFQNSSTKCDLIKVKKKDIVWSVIFFATKELKLDDEFIESFDAEIYDEVCDLYSNLINDYCEKYEFITKVLADYTAFRGSKPATQKLWRDFTLSNWKDYVSEFQTPDIDNETQKVLTQVVLYNIVRQRRTIEKIKQGV